MNKWIEGLAEIYYRYQKLEKTKGNRIGVLKLHAKELKEVNDYIEKYGVSNTGDLYEKESRAA